MWKVRGNVRRNLHGHGIGRHNEAEMTAMSDRAFDALSQMLGDNQYLMGNEPCGADATAFAFIAGCAVPDVRIAVRMPRRARCRISSRTAIG